MNALPLTIVSQTNSSITFSWTPPSGIEGYLFKVNGSRVSTSWDPTKSTIKFSKPNTGGTSTYEVIAVTATSKGTALIQGL